MFIISFTSHRLGQCKIGSKYLKKKKNNLKMSNIVRDKLGHLGE